jgi:hypothetical protein
VTWSIEATPEDSYRFHWYVSIKVPNLLYIVKRQFNMAPCDCPLLAGCGLSTMAEIYRKLMLTSPSCG